MHSRTSPLAKEHSHPPIRGSRTAVRVLLRAAAVALASTLALAQSPLTTTFITTPGSGALGNRAVYFDLAVTVPLVISQLDVNAYAGTGTSVIEFWTVPNTFIGNTGNQALWSLRGASANVTAAPLGSPTMAPMIAPFALEPGNYGVAVVYRGTLGPAYSVGTGSNQIHATSEMTLYAGASGSIFSSSYVYPRVWNGSIHYRRTEYGPGCIRCPASLYEEFVVASSFDLNNTTIGHLGGTTFVHGGGTFVPPSPAAVDLLLGDDDETTITLGNPFPLPCGGVATTLTVCSNGFVSTASNGVSYSPSVSSMLSAPNTAWWCWHDFNAGAGGAIKHEVYGTEDIITWQGVYDFGTTSPSTWQLVFRSNGDVEWRFLTMSPVGATSRTIGFVVGYSPGGTSHDFGETNINMALPQTVCCTDAVPLRLQASGRAVVGANVSLVASNVPVGSPFGFVLYGLTRYEPGLPIPGLPGCDLHNDFVLSDLTVGPLAASFTTNAQFLNPVFNFLGLDIQAQAAVLTTGTPGVLTSNGVSILIEP